MLQLLENYSCKNFDIFNGKINIVPLFCGTFLLLDIFVFGNFRAKVFSVIFLFLKYLNNNKKYNVTGVVNV